MSMMVNTDTNEENILNVNSSGTIVSHQRNGEQPSPPSVMSATSTASSTQTASSLAMGNAEFGHSNTTFTPQSELESASILADNTSNSTPISPSPPFELQHTALNNVLLRIVRSTTLEVSHYEKVSELLLHGASPNCLSEDENPVLHWASLSNLPHVVLLLLCAGANIDARNPMGQTALAWAAITGSVSVIRVLLDFKLQQLRDTIGTNSVTSNTPHTTDIALSSSSLDMIEKGYYNFIHDPCQEGFTPLHCAVRYNKRFAADYLWSRGASLSMTDVVGRSLLHHAAEFNHLPMAQLLVSRGASIAARDAAGQTFLHVIARVGALDTATSMIRHYGATRVVLARDKEQKTAADVALSHDHTSLARYFRGASSNSIFSRLSRLFTLDAEGKSNSNWWIGRWLVTWVAVWAVHFMLEIRPGMGLGLPFSLIFGLFSIATVGMWFVAHYADPGYVRPEPPRVLAKGGGLYAGVTKEKAVTKTGEKVERALSRALAAQVELLCDDVIMSAKAKANGNESAPAFTSLASLASRESEGECESGKLMQSQLQSSMEDDGEDIQDMQERRQLLRATDNDLTVSSFDEDENTKSDEAWSTEVDFPASLRLLPGLVYPLPISSPSAPVSSVCSSFGTWFSSGMLPSDDEIEQVEWDDFTEFKYEQLYRLHDGTEGISNHWKRNTASTHGSSSSVFDTSARIGLKDLKDPQSATSSRVFVTSRYLRFTDSMSPLKRPWGCIRSMWKMFFGHYAPVRNDLLPTRTLAYSTECVEDTVESTDLQDFLSFSSSGEVIDANSTSNVNGVDTTSPMLAFTSTAATPISRKSAWKRLRNFILSGSSERPITEATISYARRNPQVSSLFPVNPGVISYLSSSSHLNPRKGLPLSASAVPSPLPISSDQMVSRYSTNPTAVAAMGRITPCSHPHFCGALYREMVETGHTAPSTVCVTCRVAKPLRAKHCRRCDRCVYRMDHHCPWVDNCVGAGNYRSFFLFITLGSVMSVAYVILSVLYLIKFRFMAVFALINAIHALIMALFVSMLWFTHIYLVFADISTQEHMFNIDFGEKTGFVANVVAFFNGYQNQPLRFVKSKTNPMVAEWLSLPTHKHNSLQLYIAPLLSSNSGISNAGNNTNNSETQTAL